MMLWCYDAMILNNRHDAVMLKKKRHDAMMLYWPQTGKYIFIFLSQSPFNRVYWFSSDKLATVLDGVLENDTISVLIHLQGNILYHTYILYFKRWICLHGRFHVKGPRKKSTSKSEFFLGNVKDIKANWWFWPFLNNFCIFWVFVAKN